MASSDALTEALRRQATLRQQMARSTDVTTGAPANVRAIVGGRDRPEDRLSTLQQYYPSATPDPVDPQNFIYTDPQTGQRKLYNPRGLDPGDIASVAREGLQTVGSIAGVGLGSPLGLAGAAAGSALGGAAGEELYQLGSRALGAQDTRSMGERAIDTGLIGAASVAGPAAGATAGAGLRAGTKGALRAGTPRQEVIQSMEDLARFGTSPSLAQATTNPAIDALETFVSRTPGGAGRIRKAADKTRESVQQHIDRITGQTDPEVAGQTISEGISGTGGFIDRFRQEASKRYNEVDKFIPQETSVSTINTREMLADLTQKVPDVPEWNEILVTPAVGRIAKATPEMVPYAVLKQLRSAVGAKLANAGLISDIPRGDLKQLYGAITKDLEAAAAAAGPDAMRAVREANAYYKSNLANIDNLLEPLLRNRTPERVYKALELSGREGSTLIRQVRQSLKSDQWEVVVKTVLRRMGRAAPGQQGAEGEAFSFTTMLTNWNKLDQQAKAELFSSPRLRGLREDYEALARAAGRIRESSQAFANPSGTAQGLIGQAMLYGGGGSLVFGAATGQTDMLWFPAILGVAALGANASARLMTSPKFVRWLAAATRVKPQGWGAHIGRLGAVAAISDPETRRDIVRFLDVMGSADKERTNGVQEVQGQQEGRAR